MTSSFEQLAGRAESSGLGSSCAVAPLGAGPRRTRIRAVTRAGAVGRRMFTAAEVGAGNRQAAGRGAPGRGAAEELQVRSGCRSRGLAEAGGRAANVAALGPACGGGERCVPSAPSPSLPQLHTFPPAGRGLLVPPPGALPPLRVFRSFSAALSPPPQHERPSSSQAAPLPSPALSGVSWRGSPGVSRSVSVRSAHTPWVDLTLQTRSSSLNY